MTTTFGDEESGDAPRVFVTRRLPGRALERLATVAVVDVWPGAEPPSLDALCAGIAGAAGLLCMLTDRIDAPLLDAADALRVVANLAVGYDNLDLSELSRRRIPAGNTPGVLTEATADLAMALILAVARRLVEARQFVLDGRWKTWEPATLLGLEMCGATLGLVGTGRIGEAVARRARGFGMELLGWSRSRRPIDGLTYVELDELLARSNVVSLHVALSTGTHHLIGAPQLALMRSDAILVNTARGPVVDQSALAEALANGTIAAAGLDVTEDEPVLLGDPLLVLDNCVVLPHIGSATVETRQKMAELAVDNVLAGLAGERLPNCLNPEVYAPKD